MPTIKVDKKKGLFQKAATTIDQAGTLSGQLRSIKSAGAGDTLLLADSGKTIVVGGTAGTIIFPADDAGWHARFLITGSLAGNVVLSGSATDGTAVTLTAGLATGDGAVGGGDVASNTVRFLSAAASAGDVIEVEVVEAKSKIIARGNFSA
jgi:hypothetical protein